MIRTKKPRNQLSLAMLYVRKYSDMDKFVDKMTNFV